MGCGISNYFEKLRKLRFHVCDSNKSQTMTRIKSNRGKHEGFCIYESNHKLHMI